MKTRAKLEGKYFGYRIDLSRYTMFNLKSFADRNLHIIVFFLYLSICQIVLPQLNRGEDFFLFSTWQLLSKGSIEPTIDISWNNGETFLFRDHKNEARDRGVNIHVLFSLLKSRKFHVIQKSFGPSLEKMGPLNQMTVFQLDGSLHEHIVLRNKINILKEYKLFHD